MFKQSLLIDQDFSKPELASSHSRTSRHFEKERMNSDIPNLEFHTPMLKETFANL